LKFQQNRSDNKQLNEQGLLTDYRKTGNIELLGKLYEQYMPLVFGLCLKYLKDEEKSKDAVMQIFEDLVKKLRVHEVSNFKGWLYSVARNYCLMEIRSSSKHNIISIDDDFMETGALMHLNVEDVPEEKFKIMERCIESLPSGQKDVITLFYLQQKCYKEVSEITGFDLNKVKSYIQNGKRNLKICIEKYSEQ